MLPSSDGRTIVCFGDSKIRNEGLSFHDALALGDSGWGLFASRIFMGIGRETGSLCGMYGGKLVFK